MCYSPDQQLHAGWEQLVRCTCTLAYVYEFARAHAHSSLEKDSARRLNIPFAAALRQTSSVLTHAISTYLLHTYTCNQHIFTAHLHMNLPHTCCIRYSLEKGTTIKVQAQAPTVDSGWHMGEFNGHSGGLVLNACVGACVCASGRKTCLRRHSGHCKAHVRARMRVCMHACMHACMYACMHVCMHVCMNLLIHLSIYA